MEQMSKYVRVTKGLKDYGQLVKPEDVDKVIGNNFNQDYYTSVYYYNDDHFKKFKETNSIAGIEDVKTDKLYFDIDCKQDLNNARFDAINLLASLEKYNIKSSDVDIYFSGNKGFTLVVHLPKEITPDQAAKIAIDKVGRESLYLDKTVYNASRIMRVPGTKHEKSGLYKVPLTVDELKNLDIDAIKEIAAIGDRLASEPKVSKPTPDFFDLSTIPVEPKVNKSDYTFDIAQKPRRWSNCKYSLLQGNFKDGERNMAMNILAATCRGHGFDKETTYYMCKSALKKSWAKHGKGDFTKEELWNNVINNIIFTDNWEGGQYTCKTHPWLKKYCESLGANRCKVHEEEEGPSVSLQNMKDRFLSYAKDFEKNKIKFGLDGLDAHVTLCTSTLNGLLGQPGAGKTSAALQYLKNTSGKDIHSLFCSLDMGEPIIFAKMIQNDTGWNFNQVMEEFRTHADKANLISDKVIDKFKNAHMNFRSGLTVKDIKDCIEEQNVTNGVGKEVKLVVIDYLECIAGPYSDQTANTGFIANQLKDLANELQVCILLLLQTQKHSTPEVADPLLSLKGVKGSSLIEQSCSTIMTLWREGYDPKYIEYDKFISFAVVKNRFGPLWRGDFAWEGSKGNISHLSTDGFQELNKLKERKKKDKQEALKADKDWE